jgi:hypothetical protein
VFLLVSLAWAVGVSAIAAYERFTVDPWAFLGEDRGAIFLRWAPHLDYGRSAFGEVVLVLDASRFWVALLGPVVALGLLSILAGVLSRRRDRARRKKRHAEPS